MEVAAFFKDGMPDNLFPGVTDIGGLPSVNHNTFLKILEEAGMNASWLPVWQDLLAFAFADLTVVTQLQPHAVRVKGEMGGKRTPTYTAEPAGQGFSPSHMQEWADSLTYDDFPHLDTANSATECITTMDLRYIVDRTHTMVFARTGSSTSSIKKRMRRALGFRLRFLFPLLPVYGLTMGCDRHFSKMLHWRFQNPRNICFKEKVSIYPMHISPADCRLLTPTHCLLTGLLQGYCGCM